MTDVTPTVNSPAEQRVDVPEHREMNAAQIFDAGGNVIGTTDNPLIVAGLIAGSPLANGYIFVGNSGGVAAAVQMSGEGALDDAGVFTLGTIANLIFTGKFQGGVSGAITASVTQSRGQGLLANFWNRITVCAHSGDAVTLQALANGQAAVIFNDGANPASVFPNGASDTIDGGSGGAAVTLTNAKRAIFLKTATNTIISAQLGAVSA